MIYYSSILDSFNQQNGASDRRHSAGAAGSHAAPMLDLQGQFIRSKDAKERLKPYLDSGNIEKSMSAPAVAIISYDIDFYQKWNSDFGTYAAIRLKQSHWPPLLAKSASK